MTGKVTISLLCYNAADTVLDTIQSVLAQTYSPIELIVTDNDSTDGCRESIRERYPQLELRENAENEGYCRPHNAVFLASNTPYLMPLNSDIILSRDFVMQLVRALGSSEQIGWVTGKLKRIVDEERTNILDSTGHTITKARKINNRGFNEIDQGQYDTEEFIFGACGAACMYKREMLESIRVGDEYFDESFFMSFEDGDVDWRAQLLGWSCIYTPRATAYHVRRFGLTQGSRLRQRVEFRNRYLMMLNNDSALLFLGDSPHILLAELGNVVNVARHPYLLEELITVARLLPHTLSKRRIIQSRKAVSEHDVHRWFYSYPPRRKIAAHFKKVLAGASAIRQGR